MSHEQNITTVTDIYDAVSRGDVDAILDRVTDDVDWAAEAAGSAAPWYGKRSGKDGVGASSAISPAASRSRSSSPTATQPATTMSTCSWTGRSDRSPPAAKHP